MTSATFTATEYEPLPIGLYAARVGAIEKTPSEQFGEFLKWTFWLTMQDGTESPLTAASSTATGPKSKAYKWAAVLLGHAPRPGVAENLVGLSCQLHVVINEEGFNRIESVLPPAAGQAVRTDAPPPTPLNAAEMAAPVTAVASGAGAAAAPVPSAPPTTGPVVAGAADLPF